MRNVTLIAPVAPFRGGIARHSDALAAAFAREKDILFEVQSFHRLYPRALYPGESDRDPTLAGEQAFSVRYVIDILNPRSWRFSAHAGDVVIIPAWTFFVTPMLGTIARLLQRQGATVVMIAHNVVDHEAARWKSRLSNWQLAAASGFIVHTNELARQLREAGFSQPAVVIPHPVYSDFPEPHGTLPRHYGLELLCFGLVRHYKGIDIALRALATSGIGDVRLTIAGEIWEDRDALRKLLDKPNLRGKIELIDRYVSDAEAAELFARCDAVVAPYRSVTGSGVLALAQHYRRPVIASDLPGFAGLIEHGRTGWLFPPRDVNALVGLLRQEISRSAAQAMQAYVGSTIVDGGWGGYARAILDLANRIQLPTGNSS